MTCQNCGATVRLDRDRDLMMCDYCRSQCAPPVDEDGVQVIGETTSPCSVCHTPLSTARIEARDLLYCTTCHGILVSMDDFGLLIEDLREHRSRAAALLTPRGDLGNAMIDSCEDCCLVWLERGVLGKILIPDPASMPARTMP
jgi:Zn-finger nucleic acid-binding protein